MRKKERYEKILTWFRVDRSVAETKLRYNNPFGLLMAIILSAQCTGERVNTVTPTLYRDFPTPEALAATTPGVVYKYVRSVPYPSNKAKHLASMTKMLVKSFSNQVPDTLEELVKLPGVERKTANITQSVVFNKAVMAVDIHVFHASHRLGLMSDKCTTPFNVEKELVKHIPEAEVPIAHYRLILHGCYICQVRTPQCDNCGLQLVCKYYCQKYKISRENSKEKE